jgi:hypothetical protein
MVSKGSVCFFTWRKFQHGRMVLFLCTFYCLLYINSAIVNLYGCVWSCIFYQMVNVVHCQCFVCGMEIVVEANENVGN